MGDRFQEGRSAKIRLLMESRLDNVYLASLAVRGICSQANLTETECYQVEVAVVEGVNNAIKHAYRGKPGHEVEVVITLSPDQISFQVSDQGNFMKLPGFSGADFDPGDIQNLPEAGMGLQIMRSVMDEVRYETAGGRNVLTLSRNLKGPKVT
jgi:serine/threonine-protein kinase RsbW